MGSRFFTTVLIISFILTAPMPVLTRHVFAQTAEQLKGNLDALSIQIKALDDDSLAGRVQLVAMELNFCPSKRRMERSNWSA